MLHSNVTQFYTHAHAHIYSSLYSFPFWSVTGPVVYSTTVFTHPVWNSLHLLIPASQPFPPPAASPGNHKSALCVCESVSVSQTRSLVSCFRFHIEVTPCGICFSLSGLLHLIWYSPGPSESLHMAQSHSLSWLSSLPLCTHAASSLPIPLSMAI